MLRSSFEGAYDACTEAGATPAAHVRGDDAAAARSAAPHPWSTTKALGRRDDLGRSRGSRGGEGRHSDKPRPRSIPVAAVLGPAPPSSAPTMDSAARRRRPSRGLHDEGQIVGAVKRHGSRCQKNPARAPCTTNAPQVGRTRETSETSCWCRLERTASTTQSITSMCGSLASSRKQHFRHACGPCQRRKTEPPAQGWNCHP